MIKMESKIFFGFILAIAIGIIIAGCTPKQVQCTTETKLCPDGASVGRTGSNCEFAPCPKVNSVESSKGTIQPGNGTSPISNYSDNPVISIPQEVSTRYIIEHRSALNGKTVTVKGTVISTLLGEAACPTRSGNGQALGMCAQPRIVLGESADHSYDLIVLLSENDMGYKEGQIATVKVLVSSNKDAVVLRKVT